MKSSAKLSSRTLLVEADRESSNVLESQGLGGPQKHVSLGVAAVTTAEYSNKATKRQ
jgi:hypothetical protein